MHKANGGIIAYFAVLWCGNLLDARAGRCSCHKPAKKGQMRPDEPGKPGPGVR